MLGRILSIKLDQALRRLCCRALNRTLTGFGAVSARPISNEYGPLQMGALAYRFTRQGFFRFSPRAGRPKEKPRRGRGRDLVGVSPTPAGGRPSVAPSLCESSATACDGGHKMTFLLWQKFRRQSHWPRRGNCLGPSAVRVESRVDFLAQSLAEALWRSRARNELAP
jgi:hypothetical protein